jgi:amino acid adenylation domain-containing protein/FkbH-like protein
MNQASSTRMAIAATFTADPLQRPLAFWMDRLGIDAQLSLAPYAQILQEVLDPNSIFARNQGGYNILLLRLEDWISARLAEGLKSNVEHVTRTCEELAQGLEALRERSSAQNLVFFCPVSSSLPAEYREPLETIQRTLRARLQHLAHTHCWDHAELLRMYALPSFEDPASDRLGHIPYTDRYFAALASLFARRIGVLLRSRYKVIAVDCDNTLWKGVCGEDGASGVTITPAHAAFQRLLVEQHDAGMLLCLCTKNNPADLEAVFAARTDMPLRLEHVVASRVNWQPKSSNLHALARELDLGLDSFIFIDDSSLECAEVRANCPAVLTLQFPQDPAAMTDFMSRAWAFDRVAVTDEARRRTEQYKENRARNEALASASGLDQFLASLQLNVQMSVIEPGTLPRVAELVQRTNQFNLTGIRRSASELQRLLDGAELAGLTIRVQDRFGDYGLVGAVLYRLTDDAVEVDTFVLSCRALGRKVEHHIVEQLAQIARDSGRSQVVLPFTRTRKNVPAWQFLEQCLHEFRVPAETDDTASFVIPRDALRGLIERSTTLAAPTEDTPRADSHSKQDDTTRHQWHETAYRLSDLSILLSELGTSCASAPPVEQEQTAPRTELESTLTDLWADILDLDAQDVGVTTDFFRLGGTSLSAVRILARMQADLGVELSVFDFFEAPTVAGVAAKLATAASSSVPIDRVDRNSALVLSGAQLRLWFIDRLEGSNASYHLPLALRLRGELDYSALQGALNQLLKRHEILRTHFDQVGEEPEQKIVATAQLELRRIDLDRLDSAAREVATARRLREEFSTPFDLRAGPLIRGLLIRTQADEHVLLLTMHHIVSDGWSLGVLLDDLGASYDDIRANRPSTLPALPIQYADYAQWQRRWVAGPEVQRQLQYWIQHLQGSPELLELPTDRPRPVVQSYRGSSEPVNLGRELTADLQTLARQHDMTATMALYAGWLLLLSKLSRQDDIVIGMPVANRRRAELEGLIGFFVNSLPLRLSVQPDSSVTALLQRVKRVMLDAFANEDVPFDQIVKALRPTRSLRHAPIFQVMFVFQSASRPTPGLSGLQLEAQEVPLHMAHFDLTLSLQETADGIAGALNYATDLFDASTVRRWVDCFKVLLHSMANDASQSLATVPYVPVPERHRLTDTFNATGAPYPHDKLIHELFEAQARRIPGVPAVVYQDRSLSFGALNAMSNQLARHLREAGIGSGELVGICMERGIDVMIAILATLKAGAAYVPLDPDYPAARLKHILEDAAPRAILTHLYLQTRLPDTSIPSIAVDAQWQRIEQEADGDIDPRSIGVTSRNLAYTLYTSGSTGRPKGVMIEHRNVLSLWQGLEAIYQQCGACERVAVNASLSFDASVKQYMQLLSGRTVVMVPQACRWDPSLLLSFIDRQRIDAIDCTPMQLKAWLSAGLLTRQEGHRPQLVLVGGEAIDGPLWRTLAQATGTEFFNVYGPTESTVDTTYARLRGDNGPPHIGRPMQNRQVYILDAGRQIVPVGVPGEIYIGGEGVARGYANRPELTQQRFSPNPFRAELSSLYKSGDLARWRDDGSIEYLGRNDDQVKLRGYRIELEDIASQLDAHPGIEDAAVIVRDDPRGEPCLVAYFVAREAAPGVEELQRHLRAALPEYMVPNAFVQVQSLPVTANGKLDKRALPAPDATSYRTRHYEAPQGEIEESIASVWRELLGLDRVGRDDNFFELGGHSLLATQVIARVEDRLSMALSIRSLFEFPTLRQFAAEAASARHSPVSAAPTDDDEDIDGLLEQIAAMSQAEVRERLHDYSMKGGR